MKVSALMYALGFSSIIVSAYQYLSGEGDDNKSDGLFVGHWAPTFFILGKIAEDRENA